MKNTAKFKYPSPIVFEFLRYFGLSVSKILWRIKYHNTENIPPDLSRGVLVVPNHQTYIDPVWISLPIKRKMRYMAYDKACDWLIIGKIIRFLGAFPVTLEGAGAIKAWREAKNALADKAALIIFPEGAREFADGKLLPMKPGAVRLAIEADVPILPVTVRGANKIWARGMKYPHFFHRVEIYFHPVLEVKKPAVKAEMDAHLEKITQQIAAAIESKM